MQQKVKSSLEYTLYIPEDGSAISDLSPLQCGDVDNIDDNLNGTTQSNIAQSFDTNSPIEISRYRQFQQSTLTVTIPEEISSEIYNWKKRNCMVGMQRRFFCEGELDHAHHYGYVNISSAEVENAVNKGLFGRYGIPTISFPVVFGLYQYYDSSGPYIHIEEGWNPIQVTFCDNEFCTPCGGSSFCNEAYALYSNEIGDTKINRLVINNGSVFSEGFNQLVGLNKTAIYCHKGRLFVGFNEDNNIGVMDNQSDVTGEITTPKANMIFTSIGNENSWVVDIVGSGGVVYALWTDGATSGVSRNISDGIGDIAWDEVFSVSGTAYDISAIGSGVVVAINGDVYTNYNNGVGDFDRLASTFNVIAISAFLPDFSLPNCPAFYALSDNTELYGYQIDSGYELLFSDATFCTEESSAVLRTSVDGYGVWISRSMPRKGVSTVLKNFGKGGDCEWFNFENTQTFTLDCDQEVSIDTCSTILVGEFAAIRVDVTLNSPLGAGYVVVCFQDGTTLPGYLYPERATGTQYLGIQTTEDVFCTMRGGIRSLNCEYSVSYPCKSWHEQAFDMCPSNPNVSILVLGASCPTGEYNSKILVKSIDSEANIEDLMTCGETDGCLPC